MIHTFRTIWQGLDWSYLVDILMAVVPALICITVHETCHGLVAYRLGDDTAKKAGRLTFNPIKHIDIMGLLMMVVFHFGWAKPVPVDMMKFSNPKRGMAITALAGPVSNVLLTIVVLAVYGPVYVLSVVHGGEVLHILAEMLFMTAYLSMALAVFNLLPVPPLDGSKVLYSALSDQNYMKLMYYERYGMIVMLVLVASGILGTPLSHVTKMVFDWLFAIAQTTANWTLALIWG